MERNLQVEVFDKLNHKIDKTEEEIEEYNKKISGIAELIFEIYKQSKQLSQS